MEMSSHDQPATNGMTSEMSISMEAREAILSTYGNKEQDPLRRAKLYRPFSPKISSPLEILNKDEMEKYLANWNPLTQEATHTGGHDAGMHAQQDMYEQRHPDCKFGLDSSLWEEKEPLRLPSNAATLQAKAWEMMKASPKKEDT